MPDQTPDTNTDNVKPVSLRGDAPSTPPPAPAPTGPSSAVLVAVAFVGGAILMMLFVLIFGSSLFDNSDDTLTESDVRAIVDESVGTQVAQASLGVSKDGSVDAAAVQQLVDQAVGTQVAMLRPTNTPIPPTPTVIPPGVAEENDAFLGPEDAPVVIVEFSDFQCGFCGRWYQETLPQILEAYPEQVKFVYRDFPIFGEESMLAAMAAECAEEQNPDAFWEMHNRLFDRLTKQEDTPLNEDSMVSYAEDLGLDTGIFRECVSSQKYYDEVLADFRAAQEYGLRGTPGFVINGTVYAVGAQPFEVFQGIIENELQNATAGS